ncbi:MAG: AraC family transcriptional regulator ligand-binding domain-containing protein [Polyangiales bacterium]
MGGRNERERDANGEDSLDAAHLRPSIHPTYARLLAAELKRRGFGEAALIEGTRIARTPLLEGERFLSFEQFRRLAVRGMELTDEPWLGLDVGRSTQISSHGPLGYAMVSSADVGQALSVIERYSALRLQVAGFSLAHDGGRVQLRIEDVLGWGALEEYISLHIIGAISLVFETVSGTQLSDTRAAFTYPAPDWAGEYATRLRAVTLEFDAPCCMIDMPESFAATHCITADASAFRQALRLCERAEAQHQSDGDGAQKVLDHLLDREGEYPSLKEMAKTLHMSERTLNRKLKAQGTSYQMLLDDVRQELAVWYLEQTEMPVEAIAERLGYRDTSNFSRTCKRWFGVTPRAIRAG